MQTITPSSMPSIAVLVSGNGSNLQALIDARNGGTLDANIVLVLSNNETAYALERAKRAGIETVCVPHRTFPTREEFDAHVVAELRRRNVEWVVFAGFMRLITNVLLNAYENRILNLHPSLLPAFPGKNAIEQALAYGVKVSGCSVHLVTTEMDAGPIVDQVTVPVQANDTAETLGQRIHAAEHSLLVRCVQAAVTGRLRVEARGARSIVHVEPA
jgi:phosphoribosylglycinamide formyltransferase 1